MPRREGEVFRLGTAIFRTPANQAATGGLAEREKDREARLLHANARKRQPHSEWLRRPVPRSIDAIAHDRLPSSWPSPDLIP
jgi:hypothetical protein